MEKYGVKKDILHTDLRDEESRLMSEISRLMGDPTKTANDRSGIEKRLQDVRAKLTELDMKSEQP